MQDSLGILTITNPRGTVTIPKKLRDVARLPKQAVLAAFYQNGKFIFEPVTSNYPYPVREYSDAEIAQFLKDDKLSPQLAKKLDRKFGFEPFSSSK